MRSRFMAFILLLPATSAFAFEPAKAGAKREPLKQGDQVFVVTDYARLTSADESVVELKWGTSLTIDKVDDQRVTGVVKLDGNEKIGSVALRDIKAVLNNQSLVRFTCPGMGLSWLPSNGA